ncbi:MAG TPA: MgtC/SapB family protein [Polyangia bacterium]|nr:MgtC/SapB family protein [Polyangia bacterium]
MSDLVRHLPPDVVKIALVLSLSFLIGLEREEHRVHDQAGGFGGVRTFPLIGLTGYGLALLSGAQLLPLAAGLLVVGGFMLMSYRQKLAKNPEGAGITSEISALVTYVIGALVFYEHIWIACALCVASVLLLELKQGLESLARRIAPEEIASFAKFLLLSVVILPVVPNQSFTRFEINPFKTWLVVVAVSGVSYGSYVLQRWLRGRGGVLLCAVLGGAYSSTVTTVVLARHAKDAHAPHLYSGSILTASGMMYLRLVLLLLLFNRALAMKLAAPFVGLAAIAIAFGWWWSRRAESSRGAPANPPNERNPLALGAALLFAVMFVTILVATRVVAAHLGRRGIYSLAALLGVVDVDPFILSLAQGDAPADPGVVASSIAIAAASNNLAKGAYAFFFADRKTGWMSFALLAGLAGLGFLPWLWL